MSNIRRYVLVDAGGIEQDYEYATLQEAIAAAGETDAVVERTYVFYDSELVWTPDGSDVWPPPKEG